MLGLMGYELIQFLKIGDPNISSYAARFMATHGLMKAIKDFDYSSGALSDQQIFQIENKIRFLLKQDSHNAKGGEKTYIFFAGSS